MRTQTLWAAALALALCPRAEAQPLSAAGEFLNVPSSNAFVPGTLWLQLAGSSFKPRVATSGYSEVVAGISYVGNDKLAADLHLLMMPKTPPTGAEAGLPGGGPAGESLTGAILGLRFRHAFAKRTLPALVAGVEIASQKYVSRNQMVWAWWQDSDQFSPFAAFTKTFLAGQAAGKPVFLTWDAGIGWGRFRGYGPISGLPKVVGVFGAAAVAYQGASLVAEADGRSLNLAVRYEIGALRATVAAVQAEHFAGDRYGNKRPTHYTVGLSYLMSGLPVLPGGSARPPQREVIAPPTRLLAPAGTRFDLEGTTARISWAPPDAASSTGVNIYLGTSPDGPWRKVNSTPLPGSSVTLRGIRDGASTYVSLASVDRSGREGPRTEPLSAKAAEAPPVVTAAPTLVPTAAPTAAPTGVPTVAAAKATAAPAATRPVAPKPTVKPAATKAPLPKPTAPKAVVPAAGAPLPSPAAIKGTSVGGSVKVTWQAVAGASKYNIYMATEPGGALTKVNASDLTGTEFRLPGLPGGVPFFFTVVAVGADGKEGKKSKEVSVVP